MAKNTNGASAATTHGQNHDNDNIQGIYLCNNKFYAIPQSARNYTVQDLNTGQVYQGLHLTEHYEKCFYKVAERVNCFQKHCSSLEEFIIYQNMAIPEGTIIIQDVNARSNTRLIFLLLPEPGESLHTIHAEMTMEQKVTVIQKILKFMKLCHKEDLFFRDCKLQKFVQTFKQCFITDIRLHNPFELFLSDSQTVRGRHRFTPFWAPEMFFQPEEYNGVATDIWSFGVFIYRLFVGKYPFVDKDPQGFMEKVRFCLYDTIPDNVADGAKKLVSMTLAVNPDDRPTVKTLDQWIDKDQKTLFTT